ncbi:MAG: hypothetical protein JWO24_2431 [Rhodospirillales bacterium]|nr:hypothetical protein [Rhodospirillales bacterium]
MVVQAGIIVGVAGLLLVVSVRVGGIALFEWRFTVPANRIGYGAYTGQQLMIMQAVITLADFAVF